MSLQAIFTQAVETAFATFYEAVKVGNYVIEVKNRFEEPTKTVHKGLRVLFDEFTQEDMTKAVFSQVQPTDTKALIPGVDIPVPMNTANKLVVEERKFEIVGFETDPYGALYTLQLRDSK